MLLMWRHYGKNPHHLRYLLGDFSLFLSFLFPLKRGHRWAQICALLESESFKSQVMHTNSSDKQANWGKCCERQPVSHWSVTELKLTWDSRSYCCTSCFWSDPFLTPTTTSATLRVLPWDPPEHVIHALSDGRIVDRISQSAGQG